MACFCCTTNPDPQPTNQRYQLLHLPHSAPPHSCGTFINLRSLFPVVLAAFPLLGPPLFVILTALGMSSSSSE
jgi:hypothetical protein